MKKALMPSFEMPDQPTLALADTVNSSLEGNTNFPTPSPTLATLQTAIDAYSDSLAKAKYGSREDRAKKNADKKVLIGVLRGLCDYVNDTAKGNEIMLAGCGFPLSKDPQPVVLGTPVIKVENNGNARLLMSSPAVTGAVAYGHQFTTDPNAAVWPQVLSSTASCLITGFQPGTMVSCRMVAIGTNGQTNMSDVVTKMVA